MFGEDADDDGVFGKEFLDELMDIHFHRSLILFDKNKDIIIAFSTYGLSGYISSFGVHKEYRRLGIGKYLLDTTLKSMVDHNLWKTDLHCAQLNEAAVKLYKSVGYEVYAEIENFYHFDDPDGSDAYWMKMDLPESENKEIKNTLHLNAKDWNCVYIINGLLTVIEQLCD